MKLQIQNINVNDCTRLRCAYIYLLYANSDHSRQIDHLAEKIHITMPQKYTIFCNKIKNLQNMENEKWNNGKYLYSPRNNIFHS